MLHVCVIIFRNKQYTIMNNMWTLNISSYMNKKKIIIRKVMIVKYNNKIIFGRPYISDIMLVFDIDGYKIRKIHTIRFKKRKRYMKNIYTNEYIHRYRLRKIIWQKRKLLVV